jgi:FtsZ-interacting cell division protein ZipA
MLRKICIIIGIVAFVLIATLIIGNRMMKSELEKDTEKLFAASENVSGKVYTSKQIKDLCQFRDISSIH